MYIPPFSEYAEFALGFFIGWLLMDLARNVYRYVKLLWIRYCLKRNLKALEEDIARYRAKEKDSNKT
jgi:uncharacterized membrane protein YciS (DUF1049 family)